MVSVVQGDAGRPEDVDFQKGAHVVSSHSPPPFFVSDTLLGALQGMSLPSASSRTLY